MSKDSEKVILQVIKNDDNNALTCEYAPGHGVELYRALCSAILENEDMRNAAISAVRTLIAITDDPDQTLKSFAEQVTLEAERFRQEGL